MAYLAPVPFIFVSVGLLVRAKIRSDRRGEFILKPLSTVLVILVALLSLTSPHAVPAYTFWISVGLVLSLGGDVALMLRTNRSFLVGLVLFLLAHVVYSLAFTVPNGFYPADLITGVVLLGIAIGVYLYLRPGVGAMRIPVILYILVICFMVNRAISTLFGTFFSPTQAWLVTIGATLFWLSDLLLAVDRFRRPFKGADLRSFLYYGGQLLIALSPSYFA